MNRDDAKRVLLCYRPGTEDERDPEIAEAIALAKGDPEMEAWFRSHCAFQTEMRNKLRSLTVPASLKAQLKSGAASKVIKPVFWARREAWLAAAAMVMLFAGLALLIPRIGSSAVGRFASYEARVVGSAVREYHMDLVTADMSAVRRHLEAGGAPADYRVPEPLQNLNLTGGGVLKWRSQPVGMVCFDRGDKQMLFLFVTDRKAFRDPPGKRPEVVRMADLVSLSWSEGDRCYTLAGPEDSQVFEAYL